jgi:hypothetical protein
MSGSDATAFLAVFVALVSIAINVALVALSLKLYTEYFKDRSIARRTWQKDSAS